MHAYIHACMHICIHTYIHTYIHIYMRMHIPTHTQEREANPLFKLQDSVTDNLEPLQRESRKLASKVPDPRALVPPSGMPKVRIVLCVLLSLCVCVNTHSFRSVTPFTPIVITFIRITYMCMYVCVCIYNHWALTTSPGIHIC